MAERIPVYVINGFLESGKTTLGRALLQLYPLTSGEVLFNGKPIRGKAALKGGKAAIDGDIIVDEF